MKKAQILVVDDNKTNLQLIGTSLKEHNYAIAFALNAQQAEEFVDRKKPDLVLLDIMMPGIDGIEYCKKFKSNPDHANIPVIFVTAKTAKMDVVKGFEAGGIDYIEKPFHTAEMLKRIETHLELKESKEKLIAANQAKDKLFSIIAHDLRSPLGAVISMLHVLQDESVQASKSEMLELFQMLGKTADDAYELLENLLSWARTQTNSVDPKIIPVGLTDYITSVAHSFSSQMLAKNLSLEIGPLDNSYALCDPDLVKIIVRNLIGNAVKFTEEQGKISIYTNTIGDFYCIHIADNGKGMSDETIAKILDTSSHYTSYGTNNEQGTGLGINVCQELAALNNGAISVESKEGKGSVFTVSLPLYQDKSLLTQQG